MKRTKARVLCLLITAAFFVCVTSTTTQANPKAIIRVDPKDVSVNLYDTVFISVVIENVENMFGYEFKLYWNTSILECTQWNSTPPYSPFFEAVNNITDMPDGTSRYWIVLTSTSWIPPDGGISGTFTVVTLKFNVTGAGQTSLDLSDTVLGDPFGISIAHAVQDGTLETIVCDVAVVSVLPKSPWIFQNSSTEIEVEVKNNGNVPQNFTVATYYNSTATGAALIETQKVIDLAPMTTKKLNVFWNTTGVDVGIYQIFANASFLEKELDTSNNQLIDGTIEVIGEARYDIAIVSLTANATVLVPSEIVNIKLTVKNQGIVEEANLNLTVYSNNTLLEKVPIPLIHPGSTKEHSLNWSTAGKLGNYILRANVTVRADETNTTNNEETLALSITNAPIANCTISPNEPAVNQVVTFDASTSYDPDGSIVNYTWDFGDSTYLGHNAVVTHRYTTEGTFEVSLTVTDNKGLVYTENRVLTHSSRINKNVTIKTGASNILTLETLRYVVIAIIFIVVLITAYKIIRKPKR